MRPPTIYGSLTYVVEAGLLNHAKRMQVPHDPPMKVRIVKKFNGWYYPQKRFLFFWVPFLEGENNSWVARNSLEGVEQFLEEKRAEKYAKFLKRQPDIVVKTFTI